jgi:hypothetical protein
MEDNKIEKEVKVEAKEVKCQVLCSTTEASMIEINGLGITIPLTEEEYVTIKYVGTIGKADFKIVE